MDRRTAPRTILATAGVAAAAHYVPSAAVLGTWTSLRSLGRACRWQGDPASGGVALTFDDGPHPEGTPAVLDVLDDLGLVATFFCLGSEADARPDLVAEIVRRGHAVGTHGYHHAHHLGRGPAWIRADLARAAASLRELGVAPRWYRPTYGQLTGSTMLAAREHGLETVLWSAWGREWASEDPKEVGRRVARRLHPGSVVLLHDSDRFGRAGMWRTVVAALPVVAATLAERGMRSATLDDLVGDRSPVARS